MANAVYPEYKEFLLSASANVSLNQDTSTDGPYCALIDTGTYTYSAAHDFADDLSGIVGTDQRITTPTVANGLFDGADITYTTLSGSTVEALVVYRKNSGANTTWKLVFFEDTGVTGLPLTPNGGDVTVVWNGSGILQL
jgi:activator of HSP90 ATPase